MIDATEQLMRETGLSYELAKYKKMIIQDVTLYLRRNPENCWKAKS